MLEQLDIAFRPQRARSSGAAGILNTSKVAPFIPTTSFASTAPVPPFASSSPRSLALPIGDCSAKTSVLLPSPRFALPSSSSSTSSFETALTTRPPKLKRRVTFSPTPLASLQSSPKHKGRYSSPLGAGRGTAGDEENAGMGGPFGRERKRPRLMRNVYSDNPLFEARRTAGRLAADEDAASSGSDVAAGGESSDPALSSSPARLATLLHPPARPVANRSVQMLRSPPRPPQLAVEVKSKRAVPNAGDAVLPFRLPGLVIVEQPQDAQDDADADGTDSETESEVVSSLLLPTTSAAALNPSPSLSSDTPSSSSPLRSPSQRLRPPTSSKPSIDRPILPLKPILKPFPQPLPALLAKDEREGQRKNGRGRRHVVGWESEKRAKEKAEEVRERRKQLSESKKRKREAVDAGEGAGGKGKERAAASSSTSAAASSTAAGSKSRGRVTRSGKTSGDGGNGGGNGDDDQRRRKRPLPSGNGNGGPGAPSQTPSPALDSIGTKRFAYAVAADDPVLLMTPLLTLRSSLRPTEAFDSAYEGAAPALPPRPHPDVPPLVEVEGAPGVPVFPSPPTLLNDVEDAYVALKNALFQLPATFDAAVTLTPLRTHASTLLGALTRDIGNIKTFPAWVKEQPISQNNDGGLSSPFPPASDDLISSPAGQPAPSSESSSNGAMRTSLTESQMRRMRDEVAVAQAAIKCAAVIVRDERLIEAFEAESLVSLVSLVSSIPLAPDILGMVQRDLFPFIPFLIQSQQLSPQRIQPLIVPVILPALRATLSMGTKIDRFRFAFCESLDALAKLLHTNAPDLLADDARGIWLRPATMGLWEVSRKGLSTREKTMQVLGRAVRAFTMPLEEGRDAGEWEGQRGVVREKLASNFGADFLEILNESPSDLPALPTDEESKVTFRDILLEQITTPPAVSENASPEQVAAVRDSHDLSKVAKLALMPALLQSSFRKFEKGGVGPWIRPYNTLTSSTCAPVLTLSALAWSNLIYAFTKTASGKTSASWIFRADQRPFGIIVNLFTARAARWSQSAQAASDPAKRQKAKLHAKALALAFASVVYGLTVHARHGTSSHRDEDAPVDSPLSAARFDHHSYTFSHLLEPHLAPMAQSTVSAEVNSLAWSILANIVRPRTPTDRHAVLETLVNPIFLDLPISEVSPDSPPMEHLLAVGMHRAVQPSQIPGWGAQWVASNVERILKLFEQCLPAANEIPPLVQDNMTLAWQSLIRNLLDSPKRLRTALNWLVQLTRSRPTIAGEFWAATVARSEAPLVEAVAKVASADRDVVEAVTKAWLGLHEKPQPPAAALARAWTKVLFAGDRADLTVHQLDSVISLLRYHLATESAISDGVWFELARVVNVALWQKPRDALCSHLSMLLSSPTDAGANLRLCALLVQASHGLHVDAQNDVLALATHSVDVVLGTESATEDNIELINRVLQAASDQTFPTLYKHILRHLAPLVQPTSEHLRHFAPLLTPSLERAYNLAVNDPESQAGLEASMAALEPTHIIIQPLTSFYEFWRATFGRATGHLEIPADMVDSLHIMRRISTSFDVPGLADTQASSLGSMRPAAAAEMPAAAQPTASTTRQAPRPATLTTPSGHRSAGYEANQSRFGAGGVSNDTATGSTFTASPPREGGGPSPSLYADQEATDQAAFKDDAVAETQVVEETPKAVDAMRTRESIAALLSDAAMAEHGLEASTTASESLGEPNGRIERPELVGETASSASASPAQPGPSRTAAGPSKKRAHPRDVEVEIPVKKRKAASGSRTKGKRGKASASPTPPPPRADGDEGGTQEASASLDRLGDTQDEEVVRRFFALPIDTVVQVGKRIGGSPSLKRLMDLGERAKEYIESFQSGSSS
ncbi:hypothetical protein NBRC10512_008054 [Rhodotorula toruloides]|uniref:RHTO0S05e06568g1_1 n=2 Tax=Rhodotorula toruloides TaxID=5286 RepID=A0A061B124_RHOTO|nr:uncharacterized protein RHTO_06920 [Rhodotorula toruloides NP11]EMS23861.1 hypothetical protein RHTO_06920 [Rhodotorula toruloides NP11]CDR40716.1 RHTO0S05e06568g1_1 [Rhodotorula toruloides]